MIIHVFQCQTCGHKIRVPDEQLGKKFRCSACNEAFFAHPSAAIAQKEEKTKKESWWMRITKKTADTAIMLDGAIGGSIGGILVGLLVGSITGAAKEIKTDDIGAAIGGVLSGIILGFIIGFGVGTFIGVSLGAISKLINYIFELNAKQAAVLSGVLTGAAVAAVLGNSRWCLIGAVLGGVGAVLWSLLHGWADSYMPPAPATKITDRLLDGPEPPSRRWTIDASLEDYPGGVTQRSNGVRSPRR